MTKSILLSARISPGLNAQIERIAKGSDRSKSRVVTEALQAYVESEVDFQESIEKSRRDIKAGGFKTHAVFMAELRRKYVK